MIRKGDTILDTLELWCELAGPKTSDQWKDYRSAKECARAWLDRDGVEIPEELRDVLQTHADFGVIQDWHAEPECLVNFDDYSGPANIDLMLEGEDEHGRMVVAIEAKADESFGPFVSRALSASLERVLKSASSKGLPRIVELVSHLLEPAQKGQPRLHQIRYQLLTASAAALARAQEEGADRAVVFVHEFETPLTKQKNHERNARDLVRFLRRVGVPDAERVLTGQLVGPVRVPGGPYFGDPAPLYFGKAVQQIRERE